MTTTTQQPGASVWAIATRATPLDPLGNLIAGSNVFVTNTLVKATLTPVTESGDAISVRNAGGDLSVFAVHGDIPKWYTASIEIALPDPYLEQILAGGIVFNDTTAALGLVTGLTATAQATLGSLAAGTYGYRVSQYNSYGESVASTEVTATTTGTTGAVVLSGMTAAAGAVGFRFYGRTIGGEQLIGSLANIGSQSTSAASGTGTPATLSVTALTKPVPAGFTFQIAGDTNATKIVFTTTAAAGVGAVVLPVSVSQSITTTIASGAIVPVFVDAGTVTPSGIPSSVDMTAGPGNNVGYQAPALGSVAAPNGVALEFFSKRIVNGVQASDYPYWRWVWPMVKNLHVMPRDFTNANTQSIFEGQVFQNPNFGSGPDGTWQFDSTKVFQRAMCGSQIVPTPSVAPVASGY